MARADGTQQVGVAVDGVLGTTVFFIGQTLVTQPGCDGPACGVVVSPATARVTVMEEYRWLLLEHGLRSRREVTFQAVSEPDLVHYPFWIAYFKRRGSYDFKALDAVSGELQGIKMRKVFLATFRHLEGSR